MELNEILQIALRGGASDIHLKAGLPPMFRVDGSLVPLKDGKRLPPEEVARMAFSIMNEFQKEKFKTTNEVDLAYGAFQRGFYLTAFTLATKHVEENGDMKAMNDMPAAWNSLSAFGCKSIMFADVLLRWNTETAVTVSCNCARCAM